MTTTPSVDPADARRATIGGQFSNQYGDEPSNSRVRREAELRQVTVAIFNYENEDSSLTNSSVSHSETLHEQAQSFERFVGDRVAQFGGATVSSTGHEVIACFGFPQAFEDAPQRAIRTALDLQRDLAEARTRTSYLPAPEQTWATIHSGEAVAELLGSAVGASISVVGDARNVAARLNAVAQPGTVIISPATHQRVRLYFECESLGAQRVRGAAQPVELFKVIKEAASRNRVELVDPGNLTPLIGRDTELTILKDRWEQALEELGQVVLLIGDAGLGKSRLIRELREYVMRESDDDVAIIELRCSQYHQNTSFFPIVEYLSRLLVLEDHSPSDRLELAVGYLRELSLDSAEQVAFFCGVLDIPTDSRFPPLAISPQKLKDQTEEFLLRWLQRLAAARPVLFIVEDLHWVDPSTIELLNKHITQFESGRMLSILTFRPEFETPWKSKPHQTQIALNRLTKRQIAEMMRKRTHRQTIPEPILQRIIDRTDGIPLFIEEFTNVIVESGVLDHESIDDSSLLNVIPATLHDLLLARLDRLEADREVIQLAATIGREFSFELLAASATIPEGDLKNELDKLVKAEILFQKGQGASASYIFKHALLQDAAYRSMLTKKRQQFHHRLAAVLETKFSSTMESMPALLAQHFTEAAVTPKAIEYWLKAGQRSQSRSANLEAISQLQKGLGLVLTLQDGPERLGLELQYRLSLTAPLLAVKGYASPEAQEQNNRARELCEIIGPGSPLFPVMMVIWSIQFIRGRLDETLGIATELRGLAEAANDKGPLTEAWWVSGCNAWWTGDFIGGRDYLQKIFESDWYDAQVATGYSQFTQQNSGPLSLAYWALSLWALGYADQARAKMKEALALNEKLKHPYTTAVTYWKSALMWQLALVGPMTEEWSDKVIKVSREQTFVFWEGLGTGNKGAALTLQGRHDEAIRLLEQGIAMVKSTGAELTVQNYWACLADALWKSGHRDDAWRALNEAFALKDRDSERFIEAELYRRRGDFFAEQSPDNTADAEAAYLKSIEVARNQQAKFFEIRSTTRLCRLWQRQGRTNDARQLLSPVYDWFTEGFDMPDLIAAKALLAELS